MKTHLSVLTMISCVSLSVCHVRCEYGSSNPNPLIMLTMLSGKPLSCFHVFFFLRTEASLTLHALKSYYLRIVNSCSLTWRQPFPESPLMFSWGSLRVHLDTFGQLTGYSMVWWTAVDRIAVISNSWCFVQESDWL